MFISIGVLLFAAMILALVSRPEESSASSAAADRKLARDMAQFRNY